MPQNDPKHFDYIFTGGGLSALMTVFKMSQNPYFDTKQILILNDTPKNQDDRTWCFWAKKDFFWNSLASHSWETALFASNKKNYNLDFGDYLYYKINASDFYSFVQEKIANIPNIHFEQEKVTKIFPTKEFAKVETTSNIYTATKVFNSIPQFNPPIDGKFPLIQQHFVGWFIQAENDAFDPKTPKLMDFSVPQLGNTRFMYVLPLSKNEALVEYTLFSKNLLPENEYTTEIERYLTKNNIINYKIQRTEKGCIPMTTYPFWGQNTQNLVHIGTAGGWTKASTGYTFVFADKNATALINQLTINPEKTQHIPNKKFRFYDTLLVSVLYHQNHLGNTIFESLFKNKKTTNIFDFLDEKSSIIQDIKIILKCPKIPFIKALIRHIFGQ